MPLIQTITSQSGKRKLAWIFETKDGNVLILKRTPSKIAINTRKTDFVSINQSANNNEAGWSLEPQLLRAIEVYNCKRVMVLTPKPGLLYITDAGNYFDGSKYFMVRKTLEGPKIRCLGMEHFETKAFGIKL